MRAVARGSKAGWIGVLVVLVGLVLAACGGSSKKDAKILLETQKGKNLELSPGRYEVTSRAGKGRESLRVVPGQSDSGVPLPLRALRIPIFQQGMSEITVKVQRASVMRKMQAASILHCLRRISVLATGSTDAMMGTLQTTSAQFLYRNGTNAVTTIAIDHSTVVCCQRVPQSVPLKMMPRDASISHVVGIK